MGIVSYGLLLIMCIVTFANVESLTCGQTVCEKEEFCCEKSKGCCCYDSPSGSGFHCNDSKSITVGLRWYEILVIVVLVVGVCAGITVCVILYRRRRRNMYGSI